MKATRKRLNLTQNRTTPNRNLTSKDKTSSSYLKEEPLLKRSRKQYFESHVTDWSVFFFYIYFVFILNRIIFLESSAQK